MSRRSEERNKERRLISEVHNILQLFRTLLQSDLNICREIDESYEETLIQSIQAVPEQYDEKILDVLDVIKIFINNINFVKIGEELARFGKNHVKFDLNTYQLFEDGMNKVEMSRKDKARIMNITTKFRPIFECVNKLLSRPVDLVRKIGEMRNNMLDDLF